VNETAEPKFRILHLLSASQVTPGQSASAGLGAQLMPLLSRIDPEHFELRVINFAPGEKQAALLRQCGIPVFDLELSRTRFSVGALGTLRRWPASSRI
jgi:hypothetical protein